MLLRRSAAPKELLEQAAKVEESARAIARYFEVPSDAAAAACAEASIAAGQSAKSARTALKALERGAPREDWLAVSRSLADLSELAARAVAKAQALGFSPRAELTLPSRDLRAAAAALKEALRGGSSRAQSLVEAKRRASSVDTAARKLERAALEEPNVVTGLKDREVLHWFVEAAQAAQEAAERLAEVLGQE